MNSFRRFFRVEWAVIVFCAWAARELVNAWRHSPFDRLGWLAFAIWLVPVVVHESRRNVLKDGIACSCTGLVMATLGLMAQLNAATYLGLAVAVAGLLPWNRWTVSWLVFSLAWMPLTGWLCANFGGSVTVALRLAGAALAVVMGMSAVRRKNEGTAA